MRLTIKNKEPLYSPWLKFELLNLLLVLMKQYNAEVFLYQREAKVVSRYFPKAKNKTERNISIYFWKLLTSNFCVSVTVSHFSTEWCNNDHLIIFELLTFVKQVEEITGGVNVLYSTKNLIDKNLRKTTNFLKIMINEFRFLILITLMSNHDNDNTSHSLKL